MDSQARYRLKRDLKNKGATTFYPTGPKPRKVTPMDWLGISMAAFMFVGPFVLGNLDHLGNLLG